MDDRELAKELRKIAGKQENFFHIHVLNTAAKRLEDAAKSEELKEKDDEQAD